MPGKPSLTQQHDLQLSGMAADVASLKLQTAETLRQEIQARLPDLDVSVRINARGHVELTIAQPVLPGKLPGDASLP